MNTKMEFSNRLNSIFDDERIPLRGRATLLQKITPVSNTGAQKWLKGEAIPRRKAIVAICKKYGRSPEWLEYGELHRSESLIAYAQDLPTSESDEFCDIYFIKDDDADGIDTHMSAIPFRKTYLDEIGVNPANACMVIAPDSRMEPDINKGDEMLVDRSVQSPEEQGIYVFRVGNYNRVNLVSLNIDGSITLVSKSDDPSFPNEVISREAFNALHIVGKVKWAGGTK